MLEHADEDDGAAEQGRAGQEAAAGTNGEAWVRVWVGAQIEGRGGPGLVIEVETAGVTAGGEGAMGAGGEVTRSFAWMKNPGTSW